MSSTGPTAQPDVAPAGVGARSGRRPGTPYVPVALAMFGVGWGANQFVSLLVAYQQRRGLTIGVSEALFGIYALGLIPALLLGGPFADRYGRVRVVRPAAVLSVIATIVLMVGDHSTAALYVGRFFAGVASGSMFAAGTAWVKELSSPPHEAAGEQAGARRAAIALSAGFGLGPVATGLVAQWAPAPLVTAYIPHLLVMVAVLPALWRATETVSPNTDAVGGWQRLRVRDAAHPRFLGVVLPMAPWVFAAPAVAFAVLPSLVASRLHGEAVVFSGLVAGLALATGVAVQPVARWLDRRDDVRGPAVGLGVVVLSMVLAAVAADLRSWPLVVVDSPLLGAGYGLCLVSGLLEVQRLASRGALGGLTAVYYALTYVGFAVPLVVAELGRLVSYDVLLLALGGLAALSLGVVLARSRRTAPVHPAA